MHRRHFEYDIGSVDYDPTERAADGAPTADGKQEERNKKHDRKNILAIVFFIPFLLFAVSRWGAVGGALGWIVVNAAYIIFEVPTMHRRIKGYGPMTWYWRSLLLPVLLCLAIALPVRAFV